MSQVTWRASEEVIRDVKRVAQEQGKSLNEFLTQLVRAATDPQFAAGGADRLRERLTRAGLLAPASAAPPRPAEDDIARARREAGEGVPLSRIVVDDRG
ncbi:MAG: hypothetical protein QM602_10695 [Microbacterium sp.]